jgi:hypothetical protein
MRKPKCGSRMRNVMKPQGLACLIRVSVDREASSRAENPLAHADSPPVSHTQSSYLSTNHHKVTLSSHWRGMTMVAWGVTEDWLR